MIHKFIFRKVAQTVVTKISQGDGRGLWSYIKKAALGIVIGIVTLIIVFIIVLVLLIQFLFSTFTNSLNVESLNETKNNVAEIVNSAQSINPESIKNTIIQTKETVTDTLPVVKEGETVFNTIETYIQKLESLFP